jgi:two-component system phosphate regulon sensor histidine kinase PhoR
MWSFAAVRLAAALAIGAIGGYLLGSVSAGLAITLAFYAGWQLVNLYRLDHWLRHRSVASPPALGGVWDDVITQVMRLYRRKRHHKLSLIAILKELRQSTAAMPDGVVVLNADREIVWFNRMAIELLELRKRQDVGIRIENLVRQPAFTQYLGAGDFSAPVVIQTAAAPEVWLSFHVLPYGAGQRLLLVRDVTRETRLAAMRKDFVANASHELRSPLTVISGYLETLSTDPALDADLAAPIAEMRRQADRMTAIVDDLLELSRLEADDDEVEGDAVDVAAIVAMLRKDVLARPRRPADVRVTVEAGPRLLGDEAEIHSAFSNLVDNAAKYTPPEGSLQLRWWTDADGGHFAVTDTGPGIPAEAIPRLTERFYRVDPGRSRATGGSGLGLAIVKHVLQRHGASLSIDSVEGRGSTFTCHFPPRRVIGAAPRAAHG